MKLLAMKSAAFAIAVSRAVDAHTVFTNFYVDGANQGPGTCVRMNKSVPNATFFVPTVSSDDMACGQYLLPPSFETAISGPLGLMANEDVQVSMATSVLSASVPPTPALP